MVKTKVEDMVLSEDSIHHSMTEFNDYIIAWQYAETQTGAMSDSSNSQRDSSNSQRVSFQTRF